MLERSDLVETVLETTEFRVGLRAWACRIDRIRARLSFAAVRLLAFLGFAALTGNFALVLVAALRLHRGGTGGIEL